MKLVALLTLAVLTLSGCSIQTGGVSEKFSERIDALPDAIQCGWLPNDQVYLPPVPGQCWRMEGAENRSTTLVDVDACDVPDEGVSFWPDGGYYVQTWARTADMTTQIMPRTVVRCP
jgi:hypothetical protein